MNPGFRSLMWYLLVGTRGGPNRIRILEQLRGRPANAHQLASALALDYRTVRHHVRLLERNGAIARPVKDAYAAPYELAPYLLEHFELVEAMISPRPARGPAARRAAVPGLTRLHRAKGGSS
ncbi:MAG: winged helix-turn-helix domain-containing protein [Thermoplasmata archaeon]|nr:winged helix-turn-helix domain-containing protein [Thermoplasmata archaeon]